MSSQNRMYTAGITEDMLEPNAIFEFSEYDLWANESSPSVTVSPTLPLIAHSLVFLLGVPGNCLILRVYWTKTRKTSTDVLIRALAWADLAVCFLRIPVITFKALDLAGALFPEYVSDILMTITNVTITSSFCITAVIAFERYDCVCRPQKRMFNPRRSKIAVLVAVLFAIVNNVGQLAVNICFAVSGDIPTSLLAYAGVEVLVKVVVFVMALVTIGASYGKVYGTIRKHVKVGLAQPLTAHDKRRPNDLRVERQVTCWTRPTQPRQNRRETFVDEAVTRFVNPPTPSNSHHKKPDDARTVTHVVSFAHQDPFGPSQPRVIPEHKATTAPKDNTASRRQSRQAPGHAPQRVGAAKLQRETTRMLFITSLVFLLTWLPYLVFVVKWYSFVSSPSIDAFDTIIKELSITYLINSVVNPLIYGIANRRFRKECKEAIRNIRCCTC